jgi:hypothetical protein
MALLKMAEDIGQGYANPGQIAGGIYTRLWARAYMIADPVNER